MTTELEPGLTFHLVADTAGAVVRVRKGQQVAEVRVARDASESFRDFFARLALFVQLNPRQLSGILHRCAEARQRIEAGAPRAGDTALVTMGVHAAGAADEAGALTGAATSPDDAAREIALSLFVSTED